MIPERTWSTSKTSVLADNDNFVAQLLVALVIYEFRIEESTAFLSLLRWPEYHKVRILIYDNSRIAQAAPQNPNIQYIHNPTNPGVAGAYNDASQMAMGEKLDWLLFLDQDTQLPEHTLSQYGLALQKASQHILFVPWVRDNVGILSPFRYRWSRGWRIKKSTTSQYNLTSHRAINSGMLISVQAFQKAGGYDDNIPLDFSDISFQQKLNKLTTGFKVIPLELTAHFSSVEKQPLERRIHRFKLYCTGGRNMARQYGGNAWVALHAFGRALRLSIKYSSMSFLGIYFSIWFSDK